MSVVVEPGQTLALVGPTGSGKSTLLGLLPRLFDPPAGTVFIDGHDVRDLPLATLRSTIAMAPQDPFLFSDTVVANVRFGLGDGATDAAAGEAMATSRLDKDLEDLPDGDQTRVGERGVTLSGG